MDKHILGNILGGDKSISANIIENFTAACNSPSSGSDAADGTGLMGLSTRYKS
jgi:hypothetical protein